MGRKRSASEFEQEHSDEHKQPEHATTVTVEVVETVETVEPASAVMKAIGKQPRRNPLLTKSASTASSVSSGTASQDELDAIDDESDQQPAQAADYEPYRKTLVEGEPGTLTGRPLRLYADGIFDLFHFGHAKALQQCKQAYPHVHLIVGCCGDAITHKLKGRTVMTDTERYESLRHCKWVDEVVEDAPWVLTDAFIEEHAIDYVCHDALPYSDASGEAASGDVYAHIKAMGKFLETKRTDGISTSDLIIRIVAEYDTFIRRNLARGYTGKDMNVPFMKEQSIKLDMAVDKVKDKVKHDVDELFQKFIGKADDLQASVLELFHREGALPAHDHARAAPSTVAVEPSGN